MGRGRIEQSKVGVEQGGVGYMQLGRQMQNRIGQRRGGVEQDVVKSRR